MFGLIAFHVLFARWDKAWFHMGNFFNRLLEEQQNRYQKLGEIESSDKIDRRIVEKEKLDA